MTFIWQQIPKIAVYDKSFFARVKLSLSWTERLPNYFLSDHIAITVLFAHGVLTAIKVQTKKKLKWHE